MTGSDRSRSVGAVLTGGASRRFGSDKALADVDGRPLGACVVDAMRSAGIDPVVAVGGSAGPSLGLVTVPDRYPGQGPLGGVATALTWAGTGRVVISPCDLPLLEGAHITELLRASAPADHAVVAMVGGSPDPSLAVWPAAASSRFREAMEAGDRKLRRALELIEWVGVELGAAALDDADDPDSLERLLGRSGRGPDGSGAGP